MYVVIRDMSAGNAETGDAWQETKVFDGSATLDEVMVWAIGEYSTATHRNHIAPYSRKRITITKPHSDVEKEKSDADPQS